LALTSSTSGGRSAGIVRSLTEAMEFVFVFIIIIIIIIIIIRDFGVMLKAAKLCIDNSAHTSLLMQHTKSAPT
jgi:hypothetical protein